MKRSKRRALLMVLLLLTYSGGGAIINVAVAWGCGQLSHTYSSPIQLPPEDLQSLWLKYAPADCPPGEAQRCVTGIWSAFGVTRVDIGLGPLMGLPQADLDPTIADFRPMHITAIRVLQQGWPWRSLQKGRAIGGREWTLAKNAGTPPTMAGLRVELVWPGFAINTVFYAAVLRVLFAGPFALRRFIRARRGECTACGYPVGTSPVCTECGKPVTPRLDSR